jgi:hypothetical protein
MVELSLMGLSALMGACLSYIVWHIATRNGERTHNGTRCFWCGAEKRSYYHTRRDDDGRVVQLRERDQRRAQR